MRCITIILIPMLGACAHRGDDVTLKADQVSTPDAYSSFSNDKPYLRKWADFHAYRDAVVEASNLLSWYGENAISGHSIVIKLSEGSVLENTTAHPQYFDIWLQIPADISLNQAFALRRASNNRKITHTKKWGSQPEDTTDYSTLKDGEMTLAGMQGYDVPTLRGTLRSIATITVKTITQTRITFRLSGQLPVKEDLGEVTHYTVNVDRIYEAEFKPIKQNQALPPIDESVLSEVLTPLPR
jgi:hypothetical protein